MKTYTITYYFGRTVMSTILATSLTEAKRIAEVEMKPIQHMILEGKYQVTPSWK